MSSVHHICDILPVWVLLILLPMNSLYVHTIFLHILFVSNIISSQLQTCDGKCWACFRYDGTFCRLPGRLSSASVFLRGGEETQEHILSSVFTELGGELRFCMTNDDWIVYFCFRSLYIVTILCNMTHISLYQYTFNTCCSCLIPLLNLRTAFLFSCNYQTPFNLNQ